MRLTFCSQLSEPKLAYGLCMARIASSRSIDPAARLVRCWSTMGLPTSRTLAIWQTARSTLVLELCLYSESVWQNQTPRLKQNRTIRILLRPSAHYSRLNDAIHHKAAKFSVLLLNEHSFRCFFAWLCRRMQLRRPKLLGASDPYSCYLFPFSSGRGFNTGNTATEIWVSVDGVRTELLVPWWFHGFDGWPLLWRHFVPCQTTDC